MTFERAHFEQQLDKMCRLLGELWAVDTTLDLWREVLDSDRRLVGERSVRVGKTSPFTLEEMPESTSTWGFGQNRSGYGEPVVVEVLDIPSFDYLYAKGQVWADEVATTVRSMVEDLVRPLSPTFAEAAAIADEQLGSVALNVPDDLAQLDNNLANWSGVTANEFADWYSKLEFIARRQAYVANCIGYAVVACKSAVDLGQQSLMNIVEGAISTLEEGLEARKGAQPVPPPDTGMEWLAVAALVTGVIAAIPTGGASLAAGATTTAAIIGTAAVSVSAGANAFLDYAEGVVPDEAGRIATFTTNRAEDVFASINDGLVDLREAMRIQWSGAEERIATLLANTSDAASAGHLSATAPSIVRGVTPEGFHHESEPY